MTMILAAAVVALVLGYVFGAMQGKAAVASKEGELNAQTAALNAAMSEIAALKQDATAKSAQLEALIVDRARLQEARKNDAENLERLSKVRDEFQSAFEALASKALKENNQSFLELAKSNLTAHQKQAEGELEKREEAIKNLVKPISESLGKVDEQVRAIEKDRVDAYATLRQQLATIGSTQEQLRTETSKLVTALRRPEGRGRWGELQLKRVVEMAGMVDRCDFVEQEVTETRQRPDMIVRLPGHKQVVVDSKVPLDAYLKAIEATDEAERSRHLADHARQIQDHINKLSAKRYWEQFENAPEFVVMFLPGEFLFSAALQQNPALIEEGSAAKVIVASPTTLIAILRAVAYGWQQTKLAENAQQISELGRRLYDTLRVMAGHVEDVGDHLEKSVKAYNKAVGSLERNVLSAARKFPELGVGGDQEIPELSQVEEAPRLLQGSDWEKRTDAAKA